MDARVNDFFNEINEIVPPVTQVRSTSECVWQECFDDSTGYPYYWNMLTNAVTWEMPPDYQTWLNKSKLPKGAKHESVDAKKPLFPSAIGGALPSAESKTISATGFSKSSDLMGGCQDVKKIKVLPGFMVESDHDSREAHCLSRNGSNTNSPFHSNNSKSNSQANSDTETRDEVKPTLGFSLLANYGNYSDEDDDSQGESDETKDVPKNEGHSTLFPVTKPIDVKQFTVETEVEELRTGTETEQIDVKAFKRKRRIGVHLVNHPKREREVTITRPTKDVDENNSTTDCSAEKETEHIDSVKIKFGMSFVRGDTLKPAPPSSTSSAAAGDDCNENANERDVIIEEQTTLKEKLTFLSEGREAISPVQIMSIQLETLYSAWKLGHLNCAYFTSWIKDISSDLIKLEEDTTPEGWNLEWDRQEKRYFYRNKASNQCQWEYPQQAHAAKNGARSDAVDEDDDAMDICTTPPPLDAAADGTIEVTSICAPATDEVYLDDKAQPQDFSSALDSFYSDIAEIETATGACADKEAAKLKAPDVPVVAEIKENSTGEPPKKRKKVKMSHGISMKKKGVSQMVEKWKNAQKDLD